MIIMRDVFSNVSHNVRLSFFHSLKRFFFITRGYFEATSVRALYSSVVDIPIEHLYRWPSLMARKPKTAHCV